MLLTDKEFCHLLLQVLLEKLLKVTAVRAVMLASNYFRSYIVHFFGLIQGFHRGDRISCIVVGTKSA
jgi:hypothetical protein